MDHLTTTILTEELVQSKDININIKRGLLTSHTPCKEGSDVSICTVGFSRCMGTIPAGCLSWRHQWLVWVAVECEPRCVSKISAL